MSNLIHGIGLIRAHLDRIEAAEKAGMLDADAGGMVGGLLGSFEARLDNISERIPVPATVPNGEAA